MPADERELVSSIRRILVLELSPAREYNNVKQIKAKSLKRRTTMDIKEKSTSKDKLLKICVTAMFPSAHLRSYNAYSDPVAAERLR